jgi:hypothetical protein
MDGSVKAIGNVVSSLKASASCSVRETPSRVGKGFSFSLSGCKPDIFFIRAVRKACFRFNGVNRGKKTDKKPDIPFRIKSGKDLSAVSAVIVEPRLCLPTG